MAESSPECVDAVDFDCVKGEKERLKKIEEELSTREREVIRLEQELKKERAVYSRERGGRTALEGEVRRLKRKIDLW